MKARSLVLAAAASFLAFPALADSQYPLHEQAAKYSWHFQAKQEAQQNRMRVVEENQREQKSGVVRVKKEQQDDFGPNGLGW